MIRATAIVRKAAVKADRVADTVALDHAARRNRAATLTAAGGLEFRLDLAGAAALEDGDAVKLEDGRLVRVSAAPQPLLRVTTDNPQRLMRLAWHLGSHHVAAEIAADALFVEHDPATLELVRSLGARTEPAERPFRPERDGHAGHAHGHDHGRGHAHGHAHRCEDDHHAGAGESGREQGHTHDLHGHRHG